MNGTANQNQSYSIVSAIIFGIIAIILLIRLIYHPSATTANGMGMQPYMLWWGWIWFVITVIMSWWGFVASARK